MHWEYIKGCPYFRSISYTHMQFTFEIELTILLSSHVPIGIRPSSSYASVWQGWKHWVRHVSSVAKSGQLNDQAPIKTAIQMILQRDLWKVTYQQYAYALTAKNITVKQAKRT